METLVARYPQARGALRATLAQAGRELLLLESSDWPFLVTTGQASEYATRRFNAHVKRFDRLTALLDAGTAETSAGKHLRTRIEQLDNPFPRLDYHVFQDRGPANAYLGPIGPGSSSPEIRARRADHPVRHGQKRTGLIAAGVRTTSGIPARHGAATSNEQ